MDEHRIGLKPITRGVWAPKGERPLALGHHRYEWLYVHGFVEPTTGRTTWKVCHGEQARPDQIGDAHPSHRHTGSEPRGWISSTRPPARSLATTFPAAPPVRFDGRSRERSSRCEAAASSRSWVSVNFTESSIRLRRRLAPPPPKLRSGQDAGGAKLGLTLMSEKVGDQRIYRIVTDARQPGKTKSTRRAG
jgi:hypothetical protein